MAELPKTKVFQGTNVSLTSAKAETQKYRQTERHTTDKRSLYVSLPTQATQKTMVPLRKKIAAYFDFSKVCSLIKYANVYGFGTYVF